VKYLPAILAVVVSLWPAVLAAGWFDTAHRPSGWMAATTYFAASRVCHQRPERSFSTLGHKWPVCGRCAGLYLAAPLGAWAAFARRRKQTDHSMAMLALAAVPTAATMLLEFASPASITTAARATAALPLGAALAFLVVSASASREAA
jgi:uncharacterized membrane protein